MRVFSTALRAFSAVLSGSQPTWSPPAVESSADAKLTLKSPTRPPESRSASFSALTMLFDCSARGPCRGRLEKIVRVSPGTVPPRLCSSPQPAATASAMTQAAASTGFSEGLSNTIAAGAARF